VILSGVKAGLETGSSELLVVDFTAVSHGIYLKVEFLIPDLIDDSVVPDS
jgi:hypothetical protein